jgi:hypothetical protein
LCRPRSPVRKTNSKSTAVLNVRRAGQWRQIREKAQNYSGFGLKSQTPTPKSTQLASRAPARAELGTTEFAQRGCEASQAPVEPHAPAGPDLTYPGVNPRTFGSDPGLRPWRRLPHRRIPCPGFARNRGGCALRCATRKWSPKGSLLGADYHQRRGNSVRRPPSVGPHV